MSPTSRRPIRDTVVFKLKKPNSRFHALFTVRWNAMWMMPKHVFEKAGRSAEVRLRSAGDAGRLHAAQLRPERQVVHLAEAATTGSAPPSARFGKPGPKYVAYIDPGPPDKRVIAQLNHQLDIIHDTSPEGMFTLAKQAKSFARLVQGLPLRPSRSDAAGGGLQRPARHVQEPRRALGAGAADRHQGGVDGVVSRRGDDLGDRRAADRRAIPRSITSRWRAGCSDFEIDTGKQKIKPYDPDVGKQIADMLRPSMGDQIPTDPDDDRQRRSAAAGGSPTRRRRPSCWSAPAISKRGDKWYMPDGKPFAIQHHGRGRGAAGDDARRQHDRAAMAPVRHRRHARWSRRARMTDRRAAGDFEAIITWSVETWGGHPDLSFFLDSWHSQFVAQPGKPQPPRNWQRWTNPELDKIIEQIRTDRLRRSEGHRARPRLPEARGARDADDPADVVQRLHRDG